MCCIIKCFNYLSFRFNVLFHSVSITNIYWLFMEEDVFILFWQFLIFDFGDTLNRREVLKKQRKRERCQSTWAAAWWCQSCDEFRCVWTGNHVICIFFFLFFSSHVVQVCLYVCFMCVRHACVCSWLGLALWTETGFVFSCASGQSEVPVPVFSQE